MKAKIKKLCDNIHATETITVQYAAGPHLEVCPYCNRSRSYSRKDETVHYMDEILHPRDCVYMQALEILEEI